MSDMEVIRIPAERVKALVGKDGATRKRVEQKCSVRLTVDPEGEIQISGDSADIFFAKEVVKAIGRGFGPRDALRLMGHDFGLYIIHLKEVAHTDKAIARLKGRVIGEKGSIKTQIESSTDSFLSVYGNTISIIAPIDTMEHAKEAIEMILKGARHSTVLGFLAKKKREIMQERLRG